MTQAGMQAWLAQVPAASAASSCRVLPEGQTHALRIQRLNARHAPLATTRTPAPP